MSETDHHVDQILKQAEVRLTNACFQTVAVLPKSEVDAFLQKHELCFFNPKGESRGTLVIPKTHLRLYLAVQRKEIPVLKGVCQKDLNLARLQTGLSPRPMVGLSPGRDLMRDLFVGPMWPRYCRDLCQSSELPLSFALPPGSYKGRWLVVFRRNGCWNDGFAVPPTLPSRQKS
ncbi:hypothetical protein [Acanthopleuribacter pedis]|uniref:Uncharacterized protein n=1 Tax=Acanthopleuribacter pedis TaxID=442870 RepID=A0A8J7U3Q3_9BACT|nr:hypothetical protein [Acanthopleuribacter pedis]MBO1319847.1 hypothetical protein [Acanthopleuribacter pedis]